MYYTCGYRGNNIVYGTKVRVKTEGDTKIQRKIMNINFLLLISEGMQSQDNSRFLLLLYCLIKCPAVFTSVKKIMCNTF